MEALIDAGAELNVLPRDILSDINLCPTSVVIKAWGNFLIPVWGYCTCTVTYRNMTVSDVFMSWILLPGRLRLCSRIPCVTS